MQFESTLRPAARDRVALPAKLAQNKRRVLAFLLLLVCGSLLLSSLNRFLSPSVAVFIQTAGFFSLGYLHFLILHTNVNGLTNSEKFFYTFLLSAVVFLASCAFYLFSPPVAYVWQTAVAGVCAFLLPYILDEVWRLFLLFSTQASATWHFNADMPEQKATTFLNSMPVRFKIQAGGIGGEYTVAFRAPVRMKLGTIFYHMVQEHNNQQEGSVRLSNLEGQPYEWAFSTTVFGWKNFLDPELSLLENNVKENAVVTAQRVSD